MQRIKGPLFPLIEDLFGVTIAEVDHVVSATLVSQPLATILGVERNSAALNILCNYRMSDGAVALVTLNTHPASRYTRSMTMRRVRTSNQL